jgi:hypothetical protein
MPVRVRADMLATATVNRTMSEVTAYRPYLLPSDAAAAAEQGEVDRRVGGPGLVQGEGRKQRHRSGQAAEGPGRPAELAAFDQREGHGEQREGDTCASPTTCSARPPPSCCGLPS